LGRASGGSCIGASTFAIVVEHLYGQDHNQRDSGGVGDRADRVVHDHADKKRSGLESVAAQDRLKHVEGAARRLREYLADLVVRLADFYLTRSEKSGYSGAAMYDPLAVGTVIDPTLVTLKTMRVDVETRGEFTRGETVANRRGEIERNVLHGDRYIIEGLDKVQPNAKVCIDVQADRFLQLFVSRIQGK